MFEIGTGWNGPTTEASLGTSEGGPIPEFWLPRCSRNIVKLHEEHVTKWNAEGNFALLSSESVEGTTGSHRSLTPR